ncbi:hypothetical protein Pcinc_041137 [Petrolisthes cinctipes]|uniref:Uncharacterized protein n=1 Tax=Petrolisthes cinctipes TaxID=88211 RepID=A0AAE1BK70_PETCI|nr:hypothetical protein Pcinc_041137 [Petrolisthes cinctipes]
MRRREVNEAPPPSKRPSHSLLDPRRIDASPHNNTFACFIGIQPLILTGVRYTLHDAGYGAALEMTRCGDQAEGRMRE